MEGHGHKPEPETGAATPPGTDPSHPSPRGTLPMAKYLTDPAIEQEIQALARTAASAAFEEGVAWLLMVYCSRVDGRGCRESRHS